MSDTLVTDVSVSSRPITESPLTERQWVRRGELLEAARRVFERDGYHAATVSSIVQLAGPAQVAYWKHYQSQDGPSITAATLAQACASLFLHGAASIPGPSQSQGDANA